MLANMGEVPAVHIGGLIGNDEPVPLPAKSVGGAIASYGRVLVDLSAVSRRSRARELPRTDRAPHVPRHLVAGQRPAVIRGEPVCEAPEHLRR